MFRASGQNGRGARWDIKAWRRSDGACIELKLAVPTDVGLGGGSATRCGVAPPIEVSGAKSLGVRVLFGPVGSEASLVRVRLVDGSLIETPPTDVSATHGHRFYAVFVDAEVDWVDVTSLDAEGRELGMRRRSDPLS